jgi:hypothetical protein
MVTVLCTSHQGRTFYECTPTTYWFAGIVIQQSADECPEMRTTATFAGTQSKHANRVHPLAVAAAKAVGLHDSIMLLPAQYKTLITSEPPPPDALRRPWSFAPDDKTADENVSTGDNPRLHLVLSVPEAALLALARKEFLRLELHRRDGRIPRAWQRQHAPRPLGTVPDFAQRHRTSELRAAAARAARRQRGVGVTVPKEFAVNKGGKGERAVRRRHVQGRREGLVAAWLEGEWGGGHGGGEEDNACLDAPLAGNVRHGAMRWKQVWWSMSVVFGNAFLL